MKLKINEPKWVMWKSSNSPTTCDDCKSRHGKFYDKNKPLVEPPLHPNCKCRLVEVTVKQMARQSASATESILEKARRITGERHRAFLRARAQPDYREESSPFYEAKRILREYLLSRRVVDKVPETPPTPESLPAFADTSHISALCDDEDKMNANAEFIHDYLSKKGWTLQAICAFLGNIYQESKLNPAGYQDDDRNIDENNGIGYGLVQWTPANDFFKYTELDQDSADELAENDPAKLIEIQLDLLTLECTEFQSGEGRKWYPTSGVNTYKSPYEMSFNEFITSTNSIEELTLVFHGHRLRSSDGPEGRQKRIKYAYDWYDYFNER